MATILTIVAPVFGLIVIGYLAGRSKILSEAAGKGITEFAFTLGIPALLCRTIATARFADLSVLGVWTSFYAAALASWILAAVFTRLVLARPGADAPPVAMASTFGNTAMLGLPLALATFGEAAMAPVALVLSVHAPVLWIAGLIHAQIVGAQNETNGPGIGRSVLVDLLRNPIVIGVALGALWRATGLPMPVALDRMLELLAQAGVPASLVALGLTLVQFRISGQLPTLILISALKLVVMPMVAFVLAHYVFALSPLATGVIVLLAAMPTGGNAFLFALKQGRAQGSVSGSVALGTVLAALTVSALLPLLRP